MYRKSGVTRWGASSLDSWDVRIAATVCVGVLAGHERSWAGSALCGAAPASFADAVYALTGFGTMYLPSGHSSHGSGTSTGQTV